MRTSRRRSSVAVTAVVTALLGTVTLTACDTTTGEAPARSASASGEPAPRLTVRWNTSPRSVAAVGDSITRGFDACAVLADCPKVSWATGSAPDVRSLTVRLLGRRGAVGHGWNHAVTGARMADLPGQLRKAAAHRPELVTVMIGANDACRDSAARMTSVAAFRAGFEKSLRTLRDRLPKVQVYVASVPNLKRLWAQGRTSALGKRIWRLGHLCPSMLRDADAQGAKAERRRARVQARVVAYNKVLKDVCAKDVLCRYDGGAVFNYRFTTAQLSHWDWFHPSRDGQARLAEIAYRRVTAPKALS